MTLRDELLPVVNDARTLVDGLGLRSFAVRVEVRSWSGARIGAGVLTTPSTLTLEPRPRVRDVSAREVASSGGTLRTSDRRITGITPAHAGGGYTPEQLRPAITGQQERVYVLTGEDGESEWELVEASFDRPFGHELVLRRRRATP